MSVFVQKTTNIKQDTHSDIAQTIFSLTSRKGAILVAIETVTYK